MGISIYLFDCLDVFFASSFSVWFSCSLSDGLYFYKGSDEPEVFETGVPDGYPAYNIIADNVINGATEGMKMGETKGNEFYRNVSYYCRFLCSFVSFIGICIACTLACVQDSPCQGGFLCASDCFLGKNIGLADFVVTRSLIVDEDSNEPSKMKLCDAHL